MSTRLALIALSCLVMVACEPPPASCGPETCSGCCQGDLCLGGNSPALCGVGGQSCDVCVGTQQCVAGACTFPTLPTGGGTATGGGIASGGGTATGGGGGGGSTSTGGGSNTCQSESTALLCSRAGVMCGTQTLVDNCNVPRTVSCGTCSSPNSCSAGQCVCVAESNTQFCARVGKSCGAATALDNCGHSRSVASCGTCTSTQTCSAAGQCSCTPETSAAFCTRKGVSCGIANGADSCGTYRSLSCGSCASPNTCNVGQCSCSAETDYGFCQRMGASCGSVSGTDLCGNPKNVANCGTCYSPQTCGGAATPNQCGCGQSDADFCTAHNAQCGQVSGYDICSRYRTVSCGACTLPQTCSATNACVCVAESDAALCSRLSKTCGALTAVDNCGTTRSVTSCGSCSASNTSCGGGGTPNVCGCTPETDASLCGRLGKTCGTISATDNCGGARTAACGACAAGSSCGAVGISANTCLSPTPFPTVGVCTTNQYCFTAATTPNSTLNDVYAEANGDVWAAGEGGLVLRAKAGGATTGVSTLRNVAFYAVLANGPNDVWVGGASGALLHFNGTTWDDLSVSSDVVINDLFRDSNGAVWAGGSANPTTYSYTFFLRRYSSPGVWTTPIVSTAFSDISELTQQGAELRLVTSAGLYSWPLVGGTTVPTRLSTGSTSSLASASSSELYLGNTFYSSGYGYYTQLSKWVGSISTSVTLPGNGYTQSYPDPRLAARSVSDVDYFTSTAGGWHFDGASWATVGGSTDVPVLSLRKGHGSASVASFVGNMGVFLSRNTTTGWASRHAWNVIPPLTLANNQNVLPLSSTRAMVRQVEYTSSGTGRDVVAMLTPTGYQGVRIAALGSSNGNFWSPDGTVVWSTEISNNRTLVYRFDGTTWVLKATLTGQALSLVGGVSDTDFWLAGGSRMVRYNGTTFTDVTTPFTGTTKYFAAPVALDANTAFVSVSSEVLLRWDGNTWQLESAVPSSATARIASVWKSPQGSLWVSGSFGVMRYKAGVWTTVPFTGTPNLIWGTSDTDVHVEQISTGVTDLAQVWNGTSWSPETFPKGLLSHARSATGTTTWMWDQNGILRK